MHTNITRKVDRRKILYRLTWIRDSNTIQSFDINSAFSFIMGHRKQTANQNSNQFQPLLVLKKSCDKLQLFVIFQLIKVSNKSHKSSKRARNHMILAIPRITHRTHTRTQNTNIKLKQEQKWGEQIATFHSNNNLTTVFFIDNAWVTKEFLDSGPANLRTVLYIRQSQTIVTLLFRR